MWSGTAGLNLGRTDLLVHGWSGTNAETMQALMFANQATAKIVVAQILLLIISLSALMYMLLQQAY